MIKSRVWFLLACCFVSFSLNGFYDKIKSWAGKGEFITLYHLVRLQPEEKRDEVIECIKYDGLVAFYRQRKVKDENFPYYLQKCERVYFFDLDDKEFDCAIKNEKVVVVSTQFSAKTNVSNQLHRRQGWGKEKEDQLEFYNCDVHLGEYKKNKDSFLAAAKAFDEDGKLILDHNTSQIKRLSYSRKCDLYTLCQGWKDYPSRFPQAEMACLQLGGYKAETKVSFFILNMCKYNELKLKVLSEGSKDNEEQ